MYSEILNRNYNCVSTPCRLWSRKSKESKEILFLKWICYNTLLLLFMFWCFGHEACGDLRSPNQDQTLTPALNASFNHWTARKSQDEYFPISAYPSSPSLISRGQKVEKHKAVFSVAKLSKGNARLFLICDTSQSPLESLRNTGMSYSISWHSPFPMILLASNKIETLRYVNVESFQMRLQMIICAFPVSSSRWEPVNYLQSTPKISE